MNSADQIKPESITRVRTTFEECISVHYANQHPMFMSASEAESLLRKAPENRVVKAIIRTGRWVERLKQFENHFLPFRRTLFKRINSTLDWWNKPGIEQQTQRERSNGVLRFDSEAVQSQQPKILAKANTPVKEIITTKKTTQAPTSEQITDVREQFQDLATDASWTITEEEAADLFVRYDQRTLVETFREIGCWARMLEPAPSQQDVVDHLYFTLEMAHVAA